jgi:hypothetical protein
MNGLHSAEIVRDQVRAWWTSFLTGQVDQPYPIYNAQVEAVLDRDALTVIGTVPTEADREAIEAEVERLRRYGVTVAKVDVTVLPEETGEPGLLVQTLLVTYETEAQARFAAAYLQCQSHLGRARIAVFGAAVRKSGELAEVKALIPRPYWDQVRGAIKQGHAILVVAVDETKAFQVREILDEETRSLQTLVLPPEPRKP